LKYNKNTIYHNRKVDIDISAVEFYARYMKPKILIIGAGFAGVFCAKQLSDQLSDSVEINLVTKSPHFELHANFYKVVTGGSPTQACIPLNTIFKNTHVNVINDTIVNFNAKHNLATGWQGDRYHFDYAVLALGSENAYFGIPGISNYSHSLRTIQEAVKLSRHIHDTLQEKADNNDQGQTQFTIVGAGPTGVELAGELAQHLNTISEEYELDRTKIKIELLEATDKILGMLEVAEAKKVHKRLQRIGVTVHTNVKVEKEQESGLIINGSETKTKTVIWTAGAKANHLYEEWGFQISKDSKIVVSDALQTNDYTNIFIVGDGAQVSGSGTAWHAVDMGIVAAKNIANILSKKPLEYYASKKYPFFLPVGQNWAMAKFEKFTLWGPSGNIARDMHIFQLLTKILPLSQAWAVLQSDKEACITCETYTHKLDQMQLA